MEFAIVGPVMLFLAFAIIDMVLVLTNYSTLRNGAREGARAAAVATYGTDTSCPIYGSPPSTETRQLVCLIKDRTDLRATDLRVRVVLPAESQVGDPITICAQYPMTSVSGMLGPMLSGKALKTKVVMRLEGTVSGTATFEESLPAGMSWTWCP